MSVRVNTWRIHMWQLSRNTLTLGMKWAKATFSWCILKVKCLGLKLIGDWFPNSKSETLLHAFQDGCMVAYCALAALAAEAGQVRWPSKPKWHVSCPIIVKFISFFGVSWDQYFLDCLIFLVRSNINSGVSRDPCEWGGGKILVLRLSYHWSQVFYLSSPP